MLLQLIGEDKVRYCFNTGSAQWQHHIVLNTDNQYKLLGLIKPKHKLDQHNQDHKTL